jgi:hypothetical protein
MHLQTTTVISVGAVATHATTVLLLLQLLLMLALLLSVLMLTLPLLRKTALLPPSTFSLTLTFTSTFEETWRDFIANIICKKDAAAVGLLVQSLLTNNKLKVAAARHHRSTAESTTMEPSGRFLPFL